MHDSIPKTAVSAKHQIIAELRKTIKMLDMFKSSHKVADMKHFEMVIEDLESIIENLEKNLKI